ncbi:MAG: propanediol utilization protein, partial [Alphaproteobacteria bacterium]|nr:propanediol utilization protein [Alphaproteobacteria bacterium]
MTPPAAVSVAGHFGELLQGRLGPTGEIAVVSLPCPVLTVEGRMRPAPTLSLHFAGPRVFPVSAARRMLAALELAPRGRFALRAAMPPGGGAGASTASLVAIARLAGIEDRAGIARACLGIEGATDPLMLPRPERWLWATRSARLALALPPLPALEIVGGFFGEPRRTDPADLAFPDIAPLVPQWQAAAARGDLKTLADLSTRSARAALALRGGNAGPVETLARQLGALGLVAAHTGS